MFFREGGTAQETLCLEEMPSNFDVQLGLQSARGTGASGLEKNTLGSVALHTGVPVMVLTAIGHAARRTLTLDVGRWLCWPAALALPVPCLGRKLLYKVLKHT